MPLVSDNAQKKKLKNYNINIKTKYIVGNRVLERNTDDSHNDDIENGIRCEKGYYVDKLYNENAGTLKEGDIIVSIDGIKITTASSIKNALNKKEPGDKITVEYYRSGNTYKTEITLIGQDW